MPSWQVWLTVAQDTYGEFVCWWCGQVFLRIAFTENHLDDIFDSADRPLERRRWWLVAEDPFQCLATCINLSEALRSSSPKTTISCMPVHQDGSCNGLQYYATLGRDKLGAAAINLVAGEKPADVYLGIAAR